MTQTIVKYLKKTLNTKTTMAIISKESYENLTAEEKAELKKVYNELSGYSNTVESTQVAKGMVLAFERILGKENCVEKPPMNTWDDIVREYPHYAEDIDRICGAILYVNEQFIAKIIATYKLYLIIEYGYGGVIGTHEWHDAFSKTVEFAQIIQPSEKLDELIVVRNPTQKSMLTFRNEELAKKFLSHPTNKALARTYNMTNMLNVNICKQN